ncbi:MAG: hypothetical protein JNJ83_03265 [Verrucomicrobiaceae bacterium]|nr:hypothetical protein [Verrucomicrobiaceae bacterium]
MDQESSRATEPLFPLEERCYFCRGVGREDTIEGEWVCDACNGSGMMPTELGQRILALVARHASAIRVS